MAGIRNIIILIVVLVIGYLLIQVLQRFNVPTIKQYSLDISPCIANGSYVFPEKITNFNLSQKGDKLILYLEGEGICKRSINTSFKDIAVIYKSGEKTYISSSNPLTCENKIIKELNISVECCSDSDCNNMKCINFVCTLPNVTKTVYKYLYPLFYQPTHIPACVGSEVDYDTLIGENVGEFCYDIEEKIIPYTDLEKGCVWVDGIRKLTVYANGQLTIELKDYYGILKLKIEDNITNEKTYSINDDAIRYICTMLLNGSLEKVYVSTYRYKVFQKTS